MEEKSPESALHCTFRYEPSLHPVGPEYAFVPFCPVLNTIRSCKLLDGPYQDSFMS